MKLLAFFHLSTIISIMPFLMAWGAAGPNLEIHCDRAQIRTGGDEIVSILVKVKNTGVLKTEALLHASTLDKAITIVGKASIPTTLNPNDSLFFPVKVFVPARVFAGHDYTVSLELVQREGGPVLAAQSCKIVIEEKKSVSFISLLSDIQIEANTDSIRIPVRIMNRGNTPQTVTIVHALSSMVNGDGFHLSKKVQIDAFADTLIYFRRRVTRSMLQLSAFDTFVKGVYQNGDIFGVATVRIQGAQSSRVYGEDRDRSSASPGYITISSDNTLNPYQSYNFMGSGNVALPGANVTYSIDGSVWRDSRGLPIFRNTWINYQGSTLGLTLGNVDKTSEINLLGRGLSLSLTDSVRSNRYEAGAIQKSYNLIEEFHSGIRAPGWAGWASFRHDNQSLKLGTTVIYDNAASSGTESLLMTNEIEWGKERTLHIGGVLNGGYSRGSGMTGTEKFGAAAGLNLEGQFGAFSFNSTNFVSQPYYPGLRRGTLSLSEQMNYTRKKTSLWTSGTFYSYLPKYINSPYSSSRFQSFRLQAGMSSVLSSTWSLSLSPAYSSENSNYYFLSKDNGTRTLSSLNSNLGVACNMSPGQSFYISGEGGIYTYTALNRKMVHLKTTFSYHNRGFSFTSSFQNGSFLLSEQQNAEARSKEVYKSFAAGLGIQKDLFRGRGKLYTNLLLMRSNVTGNSLMANARYEQSVLPGTALFSSITYNSTRYDLWSYNSNNLQLGITQKIPEGRIRPKSYDLTIVLYKDLNQNGSYDKGDSLAVGHCVEVDKSLFLSDQKATVVYKRVPAGSYSISVPFAKGWYCPEQQVHIDKNLTIELPLQRTGTIEGLVTFSSSQASYEIAQNRAGILIIATDKDGRSYQTKTNENGVFVFYLSTGKYTVALQVDREEVACTNNFQEVELDAKKKNVIGFTLKVKDRRIETKKFKSKSLQQGQP